jgi:hypothetical protein
MRVGNGVVKLGKISVLYKGFYDFINVFNEYHIHLLSLFVKEYKYFVLLHN